jgi:hypothetical protein
MPALVPGNRSRHVSDTMLRGGNSFTEINIFKPQGFESLIETAQALPDISPEQQESSGRLINVAFQERIEVCVAEPSVDRVIREQPVYPEHFRTQ